MGSKSFHRTLVETQEQNLFKEKAKEHPSKYIDRMNQDNNENTGR
jgi:hypothetical protein